MIQVEIDYVDSTTEYVGITKVGALDTDPAWKIYKLTYSGGDLTKVESPTDNGKHHGNGVWDDRTTYTYG